MSSEETTSTPPITIPTKVKHKRDRRRVAPVSHHVRVTGAKLLPQSNKLDIDPELVKSLAQLQCTMTEIAATVKCSVDTLERRFSDIIKQGKEEGKRSLRRLQWKHAQNNPSMAKFLGCNYLGQKDAIQNDQTFYTKIIAVRGEPTRTIEGTGGILDEDK